LNDGLVSENVRPATPFDEGGIVTAPIALQLCSVPQVLERDFPGTLRKLADIGYIGIEMALPPSGVSVEEAGKALRDAGLEVTALHLGQKLLLDPERQTVLAAAAALHSKRVIFGYTGFLARGPFVRMNQLLTTCGCINEAYYGARDDAGLEVGIHNHAREFLALEGRPIYQIMLEHLDPGVLFEVDTYWVQMGGYDPAAVIREAGPRVKLLHIKDGSTRKGDPTCAIGKGALDWPAIVKAADVAEWMIVEIEGQETGNLEAAQQSYDYLVGHGLARGRK
jgi:sugar phosphate isomerase/epimerase